MIVFTNQYNMINFIYISVNLLKLVKNFQLYLMTEILLKIMQLNDYIQIDNPLFSSRHENFLSIEKN